MKPDTPLDYAVFQLSPKRSRCELLVSGNGNTEKLASGSVKPFVSHLKVAEEQVALAVQSIKLEVEKYKNAETWFTKGTLERFVRFVSTPEVLELVNTFDAEMSQLESARRIYSQGLGDQKAGASGGDATGITAAADATKRELLRAIDVRLTAVRQDLTTAYARASAAGFNPDAISDLQVFADRFGAHRLNEACSKFISLCQRRPDVINQWMQGGDDRAVRSSYGSDMSIEDPTEDSSGPQNKSQQQLDSSRAHLEQSRLATCQQPTSSSPTINNVNGKNEVKEEAPHQLLEKEKEEALTESSSPAPVGQHIRRLSVQDRINLFENKQKEQSSSTGSAGKPVVGKSVELRRLSSDVSSVPVGVEKAVLRRWSGTSDMSIDLSAEKKDTDSPLCTPSSASSIPQAKSNSNNIILAGSEGKDLKGLNSGSTSSKAETLSSSVGVGDGGLKEQAEDHTQAVSLSGKEEESGSKARSNSRDQVVSQTQLKYSASRAEQVANDQKVSLEKLKNSFSSEDRGGVFKDQAGAVVKNQAGVRVQTVSLASKVGDVSCAGFVNKVEDFEVVDQPVIQSRTRNFQSHSRTPSGQFESGSGLKLKEASSIQPKWLESDQLPSQPQWRSSHAGGLEGGEVDLISSGKQQLKPEGSGVQKMKFQKQVSSNYEQKKKSQIRRDESNLANEESKLDFEVKKVSVNQESSATVSKLPIEQVQRVRQTKGNQERNDELKMKANELEKLYAEHKLRVPGDQSSSARRSKPADMPVEVEVSSQYKKLAPDDTSLQLPVKSMVMESASGSSNMAMFNTPPPSKLVDNHDSGDSLRQNFSDLSFSDDSRGKFYEKYMQKRNAKLKEEWGSKRAEKEAKLMAMQESLEQSRAELMAKFSGSADRQDSVSAARRRAEKLRSFNLSSSLKREQSIDSFPSEEDDEDPSEFPGQKFYGQERFLREASPGDGSSRSTQSKRLNRNLSSSTPRTMAAPAPRSSAKLSNSNSGRRRAQSENPLAQSVPNFSDFRKENTKPASGASKPTRSQVRTYARNRSTSEEAPNFKEEKPKRSQSLRKSSANPVDIKDVPPLSSEGVILTPLKYDKEETEPSPYEKYQKSMETKSYLRKGNGIGPGSGASVAKLKASVALETLENEELDELGSEVDEFVDIAKEEDEDEDNDIETIEVDDCANNGKSRLSQESDKSGHSEFDNVDFTRSLSQAGPASVAELPAAIPSAFHAVGSIQDSPGESPVSWNSRIHLPFSYPHETSDIDASVDSPIGSPASWNSHGLAQTEADAARMRKKWGSAQKPVIASNSSYNQSRKDMTKGFKRLLKFGRKTRGTENLVDWISATTSEGDDDTEDGRDPANRSSEDLRKSRMGFFQGPSDDSFNEGEYIEHAPRSFFSLSFRGKGSESKPR
ncbi:uncharacterized protein LOC133794585 isoform X2 [Humulus lupulus]|uniref:uncharacterized protein LOC133794585 isoform X2 n=1 Tax=Humulus lupulus TaxID=3486 RepID=UPI002B415D32|nr:uncharacterized protein LOC133794585 isoform X2 [Humulus lupulus]